MPKLLRVMILDIKILEKTLIRKRLRWEITTYVKKIIFIQILPNLLYCIGNVDNLYVAL